MLDKILDTLMRIPLVRRFKLTTTPRWVILLIDITIVAVCLLFMIFLDYTTGRAFTSSTQRTIYPISVLLTYLAVIWVTKSYTCVIRLSVVEDLYRSLVVVAVSTAILVTINIAWCIFAGHELFHFWSVLLIGAMAFTLMTIERLMIKYLYMRMTADSRERRRVLVLGTSLNSLILANALKNEIGGKFDPVGLLSVGKPEDEGKTINGFRVYHFDPDHVADLFIEHRLYALIFNDSNKKLMREGMANHFLNNNITLLSINREEEFALDNEDETAKANISTRVREVQIEDLLGRDPIVLDNPLVSNSVRGSVVVVTGAAGSIGSEIVRQLAAYSASLIVLVDQAETPMHDLSIEMKAKFPDVKIKLVIGDVQNRERMEYVFRRFHPRYVFHAAAYKHVPMMELNPTEAVLTNVAGTRNVADLALKYGVYKFVMISTDKAVNPTNVMGCTKRLAEIYCQSLFFDAVKRDMTTQFITTRFGNVLGSNGSVIPLFRRQIEQGGPVTVTHKEIIRYFMTIPEACSLVLEAGCMGHGGEVFIFDMGQPVKIYDLAVRMISLAGLKPGKDIRIEEVGLRPGEKLFEELLNDKEKTIATTNKKIMIARVRTYDFAEVCDHIERIIHLAETGSVHDMVYEMKLFVPEYKSRQSEKFEAIDHEIEQQEATSPETVPEKYY